MPQITKPSADTFQGLYDLINYYAERKEMLPKTQEELEKFAPGFRILTEETPEPNQSTTVIASAFLDLFTAELAEVKSLAVLPEYQGLGYGRKMVEDCENEARQKGIKRMFALTYQVDFFKALGYEVIDIKSLPEKVFKECVICPFKDNCNETAVLKFL